MNKKVLLNLSLVTGIITSIYFLRTYLTVLFYFIIDYLTKFAGFPFTAFILSVVGIISALLGIKTNFKKAIICLVLNLIAFVFFVYVVTFVWGGFIP